MVERLIELYADGKVNEIDLDIAVKKRWINEEEKQQIIKSKQESQELKT